MRGDQRPSDPPTESGSNGGLVFNGGYAVPLGILATALEREGIVLKVHAEIHDAF